MKNALSIGRGFINIPSYLLVKVELRLLSNCKSCAVIFMGLCFGVTYFKFCVCDMKALVWLVLLSQCSPWFGCGLMI
jgi:hypothetical protein